MRSLLVVCRLVITIAVTACGAAPPAPALATAPVHSARLQALLEKGVAMGYPGMAFLIEDGKGNIQSAAAGYANLEYRIPMDVGEKRGQRTIYLVCLEHEQPPNNWLQ